MKIKNHYAWLCIIWIIFTIIDSVACLINICNGKISLSFIFLVLSVGFSFVSGILLTKAISVYLHNKEVQWLEDIAKEFYVERVQNIKPFEEFEED